MWPYQTVLSSFQLNQETVSNVHSLFFYHFLKSDSAMSLLLFYQFISREISPVWIIETEYIHWFFSFFFLFSCPWGKTNNLFLFSKASIIVLEKEKNKTIWRLRSLSLLSLPWLCPLKLTQVTDSSWVNTFGR